MSDAGYVRLTLGYGFQPNRARTHSWCHRSSQSRVASRRTAPIDRSIDRPTDRSFARSLVRSTTGARVDEEEDDDDEDDDDG